jgi:hypothetical protein
MKVVLGDEFQISPLMDIPRPALQPVVSWNRCVFSALVYSTPWPESIGDASSSTSNQIPQINQTCGHNHAHAAGTSVSPIADKMPKCLSLLAELEQIYNRPEDRFWSFYLTEAEKEDKLLLESWDRGTNAVLVFVSFES